MTRFAVVVATGVTVALLLFALERARPLRRQSAELLARLLVNLSAAALALLVAGAVVRPLVQRLLALEPGRRFGLLDLVALPPVAEGLLAFLLLDLSFYWWHRANHRLAVLWRFHNVHHLDPDLDVSTALRFHFGEIALSAAFRVLQVVLIGVGAWAFWLYELCFQAATLFHHSNLRLPIRVERPLAGLLVTPRMHGIHHSQVEREAMSNYGVVLPWWDRLHRTLRLNVPQRLVTIGVPGYSLPEDNRLRDVLLHPFRRQRAHWRLPDGRVPEREELPGPPTRLAE